MEIILPGLILIMREVFPNILGWRYTLPEGRRAMSSKCARLLALVLQQKEAGARAQLLKHTCVYSLLHTENALSLLKVISVGMCTILSPLGAVINSSNKSNKVIGRQVTILFLFQV